LLHEPPLRNRPAHLARRLRLPQRLDDGVVPVPNLHVLREAEVTLTQRYQACLDALQAPEISPAEVATHNSAVAAVMHQDEQRRQAQTDLFSRG
jgi:hypothetical protein